MERGEGQDSDDPGVGRVRVYTRVGAPGPFLQHDPFLCHSPSLVDWRKISGKVLNKVAALCG